jgi:hypothetical protein
LFSQKSELFLELYISLREDIIALVFQTEFIDKGLKLLGIGRKVQRKVDCIDTIQSIKH